MLSAQSVAIVQATLPVVRDHARAITGVFYQNMFTEHPELKNVFNMSHQAAGDQPQALAAAVVAYAANLDNPAALEPVLSRIANRHASLGITPAQYSIVGRHLLGAVKQVLGEAVTPDVQAAWNEAYWLLASELIALEARLYTEQGVYPEHLWRAWSVAARVQENKDTVSFYIIPEDDEEAPYFFPGQYVSVMFNDEQGLRQIRQYSLSDAPGADCWRITVKREAAHDGKPAGKVSNFLVDGVQIGDTLVLSPAYGDFILNLGSAQPVVLISGGVGITPMLSMLNALVRHTPEREVHFILACKNEAQRIGQRDLAIAHEKLPNLHLHLCFEQPDSSEQLGRDYDSAGLLNLKALAAQLPLQDGVFYLCGPIGFMDAQRKALAELEVEAEQVHYEVFGPDVLLGMA